MAFIHTRCSAVLKQYCPILLKSGEITFERLCKLALTARPLVPSGLEVLKSFTNDFLDTFTWPFKLLPYDVAEEILFHLDDVPELVSLTRAMMVVKRYSKFSEPAWIDINNLNAGMTLYMIFSESEGRQYLTSINTRPLREWTKRVYVRDQLLVHRDHFGILSLDSTSQQNQVVGLTVESAYSYTIDTRNTDTQGVNLRAFSDVSVGRSHRAGR